MMTKRGKRTTVPAAATSLTISKRDDCGREIPASTYVEVDVDRSTSTLELLGDVFAI